MVTKKRVETQDKESIKKDPSWWSKHGSQIIIQIILLGIAAIIGFYLGRFKGYDEITKIVEEYNKKEKYIKAPHVFPLWIHKYERCVEKHQQLSEGKTNYKHWNKLDFQEKFKFIKTIIDFDEHENSIKTLVEN